MLQDEVWPIIIKWENGEYLIFRKDGTPPNFMNGSITIFNLRLFSLGMLEEATLIKKPANLVKLEV